VASRTIQRGESVMRRMGLLEGMGRAEMTDLVERLGSRYQPGAVERLTAEDPAWREALDRAEAEVGALYDALREADVTLERWRRAMAELSRLWLRVGPPSAEVGRDDGAFLEDVA
jgi:hypothetical protein